MLKPVALILCLGSLASCSIKASLPNQLQLVEVWGSTFAITDGTEFVVRPDISRLSCRNSTVFGYVELIETPPVEMPPTSQAKPGYFILDAVSKDLQQGLSSAEFRKQMKAMNIDRVEPQPVESLSRPIFGLDGC
jgi:hypothetical protein